MRLSTKLFGLALMLIQIVALINGNIPIFMLSFAAGAVVAATKMKSRAYLNGLCVTSCALNDIAYDTSCSIKGGVKTLYWARYSEIDWAAMAASATQFDQTNQKILSYTMLGTAKFKKLTFDRKSGFYNFTFTSDADVYAILITLIFEGKSSGNRNAFAKAVGCCDIIAHIFDNNCLERVVGVEWNGTAFEPQISKLKVVRHLDASGQFGTDKARDELDLGGEALIAPLYAEVTEPNMPI